MFIAFTFILLAAAESTKPTRSFLFKPKENSQPQLILIAGPTGTGKSTFGMSVALSQNILKCVSTDTIREVTRTNTKSAKLDLPPELMRSSYEGEDDPVKNWRECCEIISPGVQGLVDDALKRGTSLVLEGVHIQPNNELINLWRASGGKALGILLMIKNADSHRSVIFKRGEMTKKGEEKKLNSFDRVRKIQDAMFKDAVANDWLLIEQKIEPDPIDIVTSMLIDN
jgi:2-phosphoglycerate kinase